MSFSSEVKKEAAASVVNDEQRYACLYGMLLFCRHFSENRILFRTENEITAGTFKAAAESVLGKDCISAEHIQRKEGGLYRFEFTDPSDRKKLSEMYRIDGSTDTRGINSDIIGDKNISPFICGAFLSCGSMTEPMKEYHLEFVIPFRTLAYDMLELLENTGIRVKAAERKNDIIIYTKDSESIEDTLTLMGASGSSIELMNIKILKDIRNKTNRITNCDNANIERTLKASERQVADIEYIIKVKGLDHLPPELKNTAELRLENPEISLKDLGELLDKPLGRSGVNHRLKKISEIAEQLRNEELEISEK